MTGTALVIIALMVWLVWMQVNDRVVVSREMGRFDEEHMDLFHRVYERFEELFTFIGTRSQERFRKKSKVRPGQAEVEMTRRLVDAGLESPAELGKFIFLKFCCYLGLPLVGALGFLSLPSYYASVLLVILCIVAVLVPALWLRAKQHRRTEEIQRELPLLIDLTNLGTSAGWDIASALERVVEALDKEFPNHPLFREFKKAKWLAATGFTWQETLNRISMRLRNDAVQRCTAALSQAMSQGGDRTTQLDGIAEDAQRVYYAELDKRLAALPVKAVLITMLLLLAYFIVILAPAGTQIKNVVFG